MRVIAGKLRGKKLISPQDNRIRPTLDRVREAVFSMIAFDLPESRVLDLFGGSGAMSIEALSRGAKHVVIVDKEKSSIDLIKKNVALCSLEDRTTIFHEDYAIFLSKKHKTEDKFDIIFLDPPYHAGVIEDVLRRIDEEGILNEDGIILLEADRGVHPLEETNRFIKTKEKTYSQSKICVYRMKQI